MPAFIFELFGNVIYKATSWGKSRDSLQWIKVSSRSKTRVLREVDGKDTVLFAILFWDIICLFLRAYDRNYIEVAKWFRQIWLKLDNLLEKKALYSADL
jgi:hypothetical protein